MGMNYYARVKATYSPSDYFFGKVHDDVTQIDNGFIFRNHYYQTVESLNRVFFRELHTGKSSYGWNFLLCLYPDLGINSLEDWQKKWEDSDNVTIFDEEGISIQPFKMGQVILSCKPGLSHSDDLHIRDRFRTYDTTSEVEFS